MNKPQTRKQYLKLNKRNAPSLGCIILSKKGFALRRHKISLTFSHFGGMIWMLSKNDLRHVFSIEMKSMEYVSNISISERTHGHVVFEGDLGKLESLNLVEDNVLELLGTNGAIRLTVSEQKLQNLLTVRAKSDKKNKECARACV